MRVIHVSVLAIVALWHPGASAQEAQENCAQIRYPERITSAYRYRLNHIEGQAVYGDVSEKGEFTGASGVCVALFNKKDKQMITHTATDQRGQFQFKSLAPGEYVLVSSLSPLHEIIVPLQVADKGRAVKTWQLLLHLRSKEDEKKSFVTAITEPALREELLKRVERDQAIRNELIQKGADKSDKAIEARMATIDSDNNVRLKEIVRRYGWPGPELVGRDGADAAFMLLQHSPELALQKTMLPLVRTAFRAGKLSAWNYALLQDRVLVRQGKPQIYGMSVNHWNNKEPVLDPIEDAVNVDKRRARIGLPPLSEYLEFIKHLYFPQN